MLQNVKYCVIIIVEKKGGETNVDITLVTQLVGSLGFPIVMCVMLMARMEKQDVRHNEEMDKVTESLNNNTSALISLTDKLQQKEVI